MMISLINALLYYYGVSSSVCAFSTVVVAGRRGHTITNTNHRRSISNTILLPSSPRKAIISTTILHDDVANNDGGIGDDDDDSNDHHHTNVNTEKRQRQKSTKLVIPTITDDNSATLLNINPNSPTHNNRRPVLVDAFAPWCGPCKLLDRVLRKVQPQYINAIDFCRWNVDDVNGTARLRSQFFEAGHELTKLPSLIVYRDGAPVAVRPGFANEYQIRDFLESTLPDVLERTFDEYGVKIIASTAATTATTPSAVEVAGVKEEEEKEKEETTCLEAKEVGREIVIVETECITAAVAADVENEEEELANIVLNLRHHEQHQQLQQQQQQQQQQVLDDDDNDEDDCKTPQECYNRLEQTIWKNRKVVPAMDGIGMFLPTRMRVKATQE